MKCHGDYFTATILYIRIQNRLENTGCKIEQIPMKKTGNSSLLYKSPLTSSSPLSAYGCCSVVHGTTPLSHPLSAPSGTQMAAHLQRFGSLMSSNVVTSIELPHRAINWRPHVQCVTISGREYEGSRTGEVKPSIAHASDFPAFGSGGPASPPQATRRRQRGWPASSRNSAEGLVMFPMLVEARAMKIEKRYA